jgi:hypothetical protein
MKILALEKTVRDVAPEGFLPYLKVEAFRVWELYQAEIIREVYCRADRREAVLILECGNVEEAQEILGTLPLVKAGLIAFEVIPLIPYSGFSRLFADNP